MHWMNCLPVFRFICFLLFSTKSKMSKRLPQSNLNENSPFWRALIVSRLFQSITLIFFQSFQLNQFIQCFHSEIALLLSNIKHQINDNDLMIAIYSIILWLCVMFSSLCCRFGWTQLKFIFFLFFTLWSTVSLILIRISNFHWMTNKLTRNCEISRWPKIKLPVNTLYLFIVELRPVCVERENNRTSYQRHRFVRSLDKHYQFKIEKKTREDDEFHRMAMETETSVSRQSMAVTDKTQLPLSP